MDGEQAHFRAQVARFRAVQRHQRFHAGIADAFDRQAALDQFFQADGREVIDLCPADVELDIGGHPPLLARFAEELADQQVGIFEIARIEDDALRVDLGVTHAEGMGKGLHAAPPSAGRAAR